MSEFEKLDERSRKQAELGKGKGISSTDESIDNTDVVEAQPDLTTGLLCVITTEELDFWSTLDSEAGGSSEQLAVTNGMTSDRVEDRHADPPLNTRVEGTGELQRFNEREREMEMRHRNVWILKDILMTYGFEWERRLTVLIRAKDLEKNVIFLFGVFKQLWKRKREC